MSLLPPSVVAQLSIRARLAIALVCLEQYIERRHIAWPDLAEFIEFMWELPCASDFVAWEKSSPPILRSVGLGDTIEKEYPDAARLLEAEGASLAELSGLIQDTTEIVYSSAYGATDNEGSMAFLSKVTEICTGLGARVPPLSLFSPSSFLDNDGWSTPIPSEQRDRWRFSVRVAP